MKGIHRESPWCAPGTLLIQCRLHKTKKHTLIHCRLHKTKKHTVRVLARRGGRSSSSNQRSSPKVIVKVDHWRYSSSRATASCVTGRLRRGYSCARRRSSLRSRHPPPGGFGLCSCHPPPDRYEIICRSKRGVQVRRRRRRRRSEGR